MEEMANFCTKCGSLVNADARFCNKCGNQLGGGQGNSQPQHVRSQIQQGDNQTQQVDSQAQQVSNQTPPNTQSGQILYILTGNLQKGIFARKSYGIGFTANRIIFASITNDMLKDAVAKAKDDAKAEGKGFFGKMAAQMSATGKLVEDIFSMPQNNILAMNSDNFAIDNQQVKKIKYKINTNTDPDYQTTNSSYLLIQTFSDKYKVIIRGGASKGKFKKALKEVYGKRLK